MYLAVKGNNKSDLCTISHSLLQVVVGDSVGLRTYKRQTKHHTTDSKHIAAFVNTYQDELLWQEIGGRNHPAFPAYTHVKNLNNPGKFKDRLTKYTEKLDAARYVQEFIE